MLFEKAELIPITSLENDFIVLHMEESASSQPERIFPFHDSPFSILELIYQQGVRQYVLEVLQNNHKAIKIYRKLGFETQRNFNYYSAKLSDIVPVLQVNHTACRILPSDLKNCLNQTAWFDFHPSWQNDRASLERGIDNLDILGAYEREELVGFVIFEPASCRLVKAVF